MDISSWFAGLELIEKIFWFITGPFTLIFLILIVLTFIGGELDGDADADVDSEIDSDGGIEFQFITIKNLVAFFTIFGWTGLACVGAGLSNTLSIGIAFVAGIIMMVVMASIFYYIRKLVSSGTLDMKNALNQIGEVYLPIPANRDGMGQVQITVQGSVREISALTDEGESISVGTVVKVKEVLQENILLVEKN